MATSATPLREAATRRRPDAGRAVAAPRRGATASRLVLYALAIATSLLFMAPFYWTIASSLKRVTELFLFPPTWAPAVPQWDNYAEVWRRVPFGQFTVNSVQIAVLSVLGTLLTSSLVAYSFARFRYPGRDAFFMLTLS